MSSQKFPSLKTITDRMNADANHYMPSAGLRLRFSVLGVLIKVYAAANHALYQYAWNLLRNILPSTCHDEWLPAWGYVLRVPRIEAVAAQGSVRFSGVDGVIIPERTLLRDAFGNTFATQKAVRVDETVAIQAVESGQKGNVKASQLNLSQPIDGVEAQAEVVESLQGGVDIETLPDWRTRIVEQFVNRSQIGDADDYTDWVMACDARVKQVWVFGNAPDRGDITLMIAFKGDSPIPSNDDLASIHEKLERLRNVGAKVYCLPPHLRPIDIELSGIPLEDQSSVRTALASLFTSMTGINATLYAADIHAAVRKVYAGTYTLLNPVNDVTANERELLVLGDVTWT